MTSLRPRHVARLAALASAIAFIASCDSALPTGPTDSALDDVERPTVAFSLSAGVNNTVDIGTPLSVTVTGTDDFGVGYMFTRISNGAQVLGIDTVTIRPAQKTVARAVPVDLGDLSNGDKLTIRATVADGAGNEKTDSLVINRGGFFNGNVTKIKEAESGRSFVIEERIEDRFEPAKKEEEEESSTQE